MNKYKVYYIGGYYVIEARDIKEAHQKIINNGYEFVSIEELSNWRGEYNEEVML